MHCGDQSHLGLCLGYVSALAYGSSGSPTKAQPCMHLISTMHGEPFLIPLIITFTTIISYMLTIIEIAHDEAVRDELLGFYVQILAIH